MLNFLCNAQWTELSYLFDSYEHTKSLRERSTERHPHMTGSEMGAYAWEEDSYMKYRSGWKTNTIAIKEEEQAASDVVSL